MKIDIPDGARIIIIEGTTGSGKDTVQKLLTEQLKNKVVYDYSEEELLFNWKLARVKGIEQLRLGLIDNLVDFMGETIQQELQSIFILNRFHLSYYAFHVTANNSLKAQYNRIVDKLKKLPVHVLLLQLSVEEIDKRSCHTERPTEWKKYQKLMIKKEGFKNRVERYSDQQKLIFDEAKKENIPYSIIHLDL